MIQMAEQSRRRRYHAGAESADAALAGDIRGTPGMQRTPARNRPAEPEQTSFAALEAHEMSSRDKGGENCSMWDERCASRKGETDETPTFGVGCNSDASFMRHQRDGTDDGRRCEDNLQAIH